MSHFFTVVLLDSKTAPNNVEAAITKLLAPYDENKKVKPHKVPCGCVGHAATVAGNEAATAKCGSIDTFRASFRDVLAKKYGEKAKEPGFMFGDEEEVIDEMWQKHIKSFVSAAEKATKAHPLYKKPAPNCEECEGTGKRTTTYNPKSKWDWWRVGGRWDGCITNTPHEGDGFNFGNEHEQLRTNMCTAAQYLALVTQDAKHSPFAIVTPDGKWHEKAEMGWWGMTRNAKKPATWIDIVKRLLKKHSKALAVGCDLHI